MGITQHFEVVVDGVTDHHFSREQLQDLPVQKTIIDLDSVFNKDEIRSVKGKGFTSFLATE